MLSSKIKVPLAICLAGIILAGCQKVVPIELKELTPPQRKARGTLLIGDLARSVRTEPPDLIGYHTFSIFGIRTVPIKAEMPPGMQDAMISHIKKALRTAGYNIKIVPPGDKVNYPVLRGEIRQFWYSSYWWFWPVTFVGGSIKMDLILEGPDGEELWREGFMEKKLRALPSYAKVDFLVKDSVTELCNRIIKAITTERFVQAFDKY